LTEFFQQFRERFDTLAEVGSLIESGDHAIAQWKLAATQIVLSGSVSYGSRFPCMDDVVRIEHEFCMVGLLPLHLGDQLDRQNTHQIRIMERIDIWV